EREREMARGKKKNRMLRSECRLRDIIAGWLDQKLMRLSWNGKYVSKTCLFTTKVRISGSSESAVVCPNTVHYLCVLMGGVCVCVCVSAAQSQASGG